MKKSTKTILFFAVLLLISGTQTIHAQETTQDQTQNPSIIQNIKEVIFGASVDGLDQKKEEMRRFREEKTKEIEAAVVNENKESVVEKKTEVGTFIETKVKVKIEETLKSFDSLDLRITSRLEKLKKSGADIKIAENHLKLARESKTEAELQYELLSWNTLDIQTVQTNTDILKNIRQNVSETHTQFTEVVKYLKIAQTNLEQNTKK